jgi:hypothetical protein
VISEIRVAQSFRGRSRSMPVHARVSGDSHASGRGRQHLKLSGLSYAASQHGIDATAERARAAVVFLRRKAIEFVATLPGDVLRGRRLDPNLGNSEMLELAALAYASVRIGIDADLGMAREGTALLCQEAIGYCETLPWEEAPKRATSPHLQIGNGVP